MLTGTGVAGKPNSFFRPQSMGDFCASWGIVPVTLDTFGPSYINTVLTKGRHGTPTFGMRIMWPNMDGLLAALRRNGIAGSDTHILDTTFGPLKYIHLNREDKVAEAVSYVIATQSGLWHKNTNGSERERMAPPAEPIYDASHITDVLSGLQNEATGWENWFAAQNITPHYVRYEDLSARPQDSLRDILGFLGHDPNCATRATPKTARLATVRNTQWTARFRRDSGMPNA